MEPLTFFFDGIDNAPAEEVSDSAPATSTFEAKAVDILRQYLQNQDSLSLTSAAQSIISLLPEPKEPRGWSEELTAFWELCIITAEQIPHYHILQMKLARLVLALRHSPKTAFTIFWDHSRDIKFTSELNLLRETIRDLYNPAFSTEDSEKSSSYEDGQRWVNTVAFYAHMHALNGGMLSTYCDWVMRDAFLSTPSTEYAALDCHVSAAAQWILYTGQNILSNILAPLEEQESLLGSKEPWTLDDWHRWRIGFETAEREEHLRQETRQLAKRSANLMKTLEAVMTGV
ncbi:uncharacterized protein CTRU02_210795 [Colletotrichum truncatum]|uniref:Uncharacterized protein n=1 Tax=Colletotrichum truncatum TaxID=5467 RepID=A0ACC3YRA9_COLTU